jgi:uridine phosphorylase
MRVRCVKGKTWSTDSLYRETENNTEKMRKLGCICTERECSALAAVCDFRNVKFYQFFFASDYLDSVNRDEGIVGQLNETRRIRYMKMAIAIAEKVIEQS